MVETRSAKYPVSYWYQNADGSYQVQVVRRHPLAPTTFSVYHVVGWFGMSDLFETAVGPGDYPRVLYRLPELLEAKRDELIYVCEGEKDAEALYQRGLTATTNFGGPGNWQAEDSAALVGRHVVILPDNDEAGRAHAEQVVSALSGVAASIRVVNLPDLPESGDVSDWLAAWLSDHIGIDTSHELADRVDELKELARRAPLALPPPTGPVAVVTNLADVVTRPVEWLWEGWLPRGKLALIGGHPGDGKSTLTAAIAAIISVGGQWPDGSRAPLGTSIFLLAEDALDDTLRPRLEQHGADLTMIESLDAVRQTDGRERGFSLSDHLEALERRIVERRAALVVIDPLSAFLSSRNRNDDGDIRDALTPLGKLAERHNVAILGVMHVGKPGPMKRTLLQSLMGSTAFGAVARLALMVQPIAGGERRILAVIKSNLARKPKPLEWSRPDDSQIVWHGESQHDLEELFNGMGGVKRPRDDAEAFLAEALADGPRLSREVKEEAIECGIAGRTFDRATRDLDLESRRIGEGRDAPWYMGRAGTDWTLISGTSGALRTASVDRIDRQPPVLQSGDLFEDAHPTEEEG